MRTTAPGRRAIRVIDFDDTARYPARLLEVDGADGTSPLAMERSILVVNDGGRWVFETHGSAYPFENEAAYGNRVKSSRFTSEMLFGYLRSLGVPVDVDPDWAGSMLVERSVER